MKLYQVYRLLTILLSPFFYLLVGLRVIKGKENSKRYKEKLGFFSCSRPKGQLLWFHAASVGELNSIIFLIKRLNEKKPKLNFLITTITVNSEKIFHKAGLLRTIHQFLPLDIPVLARRFIKYWQPDVGIFVDSELWPNLLTEASHKMKLINLNGRISDKSFARWKYFSPLISYMYKKFSLILPTSQTEMKKIQYFIKSDVVRYLGNLKYAMPALSCNEEELKILKKALDKRKVWIAASTHKGEEEILIACHQELLQDFPDLLLIIAPRHPERGIDIAKLAREEGCKVAIRSQHDKITKSCGVYIADTIGELGLIYKLSDIVFVGGSLIPHGGHNFLEAARLGCSVIVGPYTHNFKDLTEEFKQMNAILIASNAEQLVSAIHSLLANPALKKQYIKNARSFSAATDHIMDETVEVIWSYL